MAIDPTYTTKMYSKDNGDTMVIASGGKIDVQSGGIINIEDGGIIAVVNNIVVEAGTDLTVTKALHSGKTIVMANADSPDPETTFTLPASIGQGDKYTFVVGVVNLANYVIKVVSTDIMQGQVTTISTGDSPDLTQGWPTASDSDTITLDGTTTGGVAIGDVIEVEDILVGTWKVLGFTTTSGTEATPFSAGVS